jgi:hypothetical protein
MDKASSQVNFCRRCDLAVRKEEKCQKRTTSTRRSRFSALRVCRRRGQREEDVAQVEELGLRAASTRLPACVSVVRLDKERLPVKPHEAMRSRNRRPPRTSETDESEERAQGNSPGDPGEAPTIECRSRALGRPRATFDMGCARGGSAHARQLADLSAPLHAGASCAPRAVAPRPPRVKRTFGHG